MNLKIHDFELPLKHPFTISRESYTVQPTVIVELEQNGLSGYGEATTNRYYDVSVDSLRHAGESVRTLLDGVSLFDTTPEQLWEHLKPTLNENPFALCAIDQAAHDLWGKLNGKPVFEMWGLSMEAAPASCFTIGIDSIATMVAKLQEMPGWPVYKIKLGTEHDVEIIRALRSETDAVFRVDANCGWTAAEAVENSIELKNLGVEFIEQPLKADDWDGHKTIFADSALPILADESCITECDVDRCVSYFHGVNIKLPKAGGLTPARRMIENARRQGMKVMVGCMTESTVGISAIAQLLPMLDYVDMDGAALLASDIASGVKVEKGICQFPSVPGTGVALLR
ncbi:MAG: dipeptide epimerase [Planctomycetales bacterium]|nr:dipeptide epimerase [Planctomycetales bacterium]